MVDISGVIRRRWLHPPFAPFDSVLMVAPFPIGGEMQRRIVDRMLLFPNRRAG